MIASGATLTIDGNNLVLRGGRTLQIDPGATATMDADADIYMADGAVIENAGTFDANGDEANDVGSSTTSAAPGSSTTPAPSARRHRHLGVDVPFDNDGTVEVATRHAELSGGDDGLRDRRLHAAAGAVIEFAGGAFNLSGVYARDRAP